MAGLLLIFLFACYLMLAFWLIGKVKYLWKKTIIIITLILIPTADEFYYKYKLKMYCENEAGLKIYKQVSRNEGLVDRDAFIPDYLKYFLVGFVERYDDISKITYRFERQLDGSINKISIKYLTAPYEFKRKKMKSGAFIEKELQVLDRKSGEVLGKLSDLNYYGGWFNRNLLGSLSDSGPTLKSDCGISDSIKWKSELINKVFSKITHNKSFKPTPKSGAV